LKGFRSLRNAVHEAEIVFEFHLKDTGKEKGM
jgi:hypothetical protein